LSFSSIFIYLSCFVILKFECNTILLFILWSYFIIHPSNVIFVPVRVKHLTNLEKLAHVFSKALPEKVVWQKQQYQQSLVVHIWLCIDNCNKFERIQVLLQQVYFLLDNSNLSILFKYVCFFKKLDKLTIAKICNV